MKSGKLLRISEERSIYILQNEDGTYIDSNNVIKYRNLFDIGIINESFVNLDANGSVHVLDEAGNSKFYFPSIWLDTLSMKILELQELGIIKLK
ncbi:MAG: hypothetical protein PHF86_01700 [Candidatus Nanoarchaeia archaeon]|jgi:hypothetical protein|nr:hypothetical protein [Candidatus Nanoarchaeia archaeon]